MLDVKSASESSQNVLTKSVQLEPKATEETKNHCKEWVVILWQEQRIS